MIKFFDKNFLLANISMNIVLEISFLIFSNINILFIEKRFFWKNYIITKILPTIYKIKLIN